ncbi:PEP-CTERM sorting domain-containing protein [Caenispirillum salinarum]
MAFSPVPVPEPGTAALMVAGLALAGAAAARRGRRPADR